MAVLNFSKTTSGELIPAQSTPATRKHIKLYAIWFELSAEATLVSLRWGATGEDMFPKTKSGLAALNLVGCGNFRKGQENTNLYLFINGTLTVKGTIIYDYE
jgi:hypothetical protein